MRQPSFPPEELETMAPGREVSCRVFVFFDETGLIYGAIVDKCTGEFPGEILKVAPRWRIFPYPSDEPSEGVFMMKLTFKNR